MDVIRVAELMARLAPRTQRYIEHLMEKEGMNVGMSVATNTATNLIVFVLLTVDLNGGHPNDFLRLMVAEIDRKFGAAKAHITPPDDASIH